MLEFEIGGNQYRAEKLSAFQQLHLSRRVAPLIPPLVPVFMRLAKGKGEVSAIMDQVAGLMSPFAEGLSAMPDEAAEYVVSTCLSVVKRRQGDNWASVWSTQAKAAMFADLNDMGAILPIVIRVIQDSLGPFIQGLLTSQQTATPAA